MKKNAFTLIELLYTLIVISTIATLAISLDYTYSKDRAQKLNSNQEDLISLSKDIELSILDFGEPVKIAPEYITFEDSSTGCKFSYKFSNVTETLIKEVDSSCVDPVPSRSLYLEDLNSVRFYTESNNIFYMEIEKNNSTRTYPFKYYFHTPLYTLD